MDEPLKLVFDLLVKWKKYPNYQFERRVDIFVGLLLPAIFHDEGIGPDFVFPEFPMIAGNADFLCFDKSLNPFLVELKTDSDSVADDQIKRYRDLNGKPWRILRDNFEKRCSKVTSKQKKYLQMKKDLVQAGVYHSQLDKPISVYYLIPNRSSKGYFLFKNGFKTIDYSQIHSRLIVYLKKNPKNTAMTALIETFNSHLLNKIKDRAKHK